MWNSGRKGMQRRILRICVALFLIITLTGIVLSNIEQVKANPDMSINPDGSITQSGNLLQLLSDISGVKTYIFTANITDHITIYRSNIVVDGKGWSLIGAGSGNGFVLGDGANNVKIGNMSITNFDVGILNRDGSNNQYLTVQNVTIQNCNTCIILGGTQSGHATIIGNTFTADGKGIYAYNGAGNNLISGNSISTSNNCLEISSSASNTISGNGLISNPNGNGISLTGDASNTVISGNTFSSAATGVSASYGINDTIISNNFFPYSDCGINVGGSQTGWSSNITITQNDVYAVHNPAVIFTYVKNSVISQNMLKTWSSNIINFDHANYNTISNNNLTSTKSTGYCMNIYSSNYTTIFANQMYSSTSDQTNAVGVGIAVVYGYFNSIVDNNITNPNNFGFVLDIANYNTLSGNIVSMKFNGASPTGLWFTEGSSYNSVTNNIFDGRNDVNCSTIGMEISTGANNVINGNTIINNKYGLTFKDYMFATTNNTIFGNAIQNNGVGAEIYSSTWNYFYNNNFIGNGIQAQTNYYGTPLANYWNTTFTQGGNYWSNYLGADINGDGIGDTPYVIDGSNVDNFPLMNPLYRITVTQSAHGTITPGTTLVSYGSTPSYTITPDAGYHIASITSNGGSVVVTSPSGQSYQFSPMASDCSLAATYAINAYTITVTQTANGQIAPGTTSVNYGATPSFTITPNTNYHIASITVNGASVGVTSPLGQTYQFNAITTD
jgi:parallel beta-helix repeat protein